MENLFEQLSAAGLVSDVVEIVQETRPSVSRNTVNLALKDETASTPLRRLIRRIGDELLAAHIAASQPQRVGAGYGLSLHEELAMAAA